MPLDAYQMFVILFSFGSFIVGLLGLVVKLISEINNNKK
ncbi:putative holin-like toxin [Pontibacillus salicampi]|uniref:Holin-like toxin n=1 Tax=Pontibacillus salicampi TaxID=1449801 RepID=A0ABV6LL24_9BACI